MLNGNLKNSKNRAFFEFQVLRLVKTCVIIQFCFVSDVLPAFFFEFSNFFTKNIPWRSKLKIYCNFPYLWHFLDMLREQVLGESMWNIRVLTVDNMKICQFLGISLFLGNLNLCNIFFRKKFPHLLQVTYPNLDCIVFSRRQRFWWIFKCHTIFHCVPSWKKWFI